MRAFQIFFCVQNVSSERGQSWLSQLPICVALGNVCVFTSLVIPSSDIQLIKFAKYVTRCFPLFYLPPTMSMSDKFSNLLSTLWVKTKF